jgi:hypothetical protein
MNTDPYRTNTLAPKTQKTQKKYRAIALPPWEGIFDEASKYFDEDGKYIPKVLGEYNWFVLAWLVAWLFTINNCLATVEVQRRK